MKVKPNKAYAVLTGDVVRSSGLSVSQRKNLRVLFQKISKLVQKAFPSVVPSEIDLFRGDSWQLLVVEPDQALRIGLYVRAAFRAEYESDSVDMRIAIGVGTVDFIHGDRVSEGDGEAFRRSGSLLEKMKRGTRIAMSTQDGETDEHFRIILGLIDTLAARWTAKQAMAVSGALRGLTQDRIAQLGKRPVSQQNIAKHLAGAGWGAVEPALVYVEESIRRLAVGSTSA